jgi:hypothetical protein
VTCSHRLSRESTYGYIRGSLDCRRIAEVQIARRAANALRTTSVVNRTGSRLLVSSFLSSGVDTLAVGLARTLKAAATPLPSEFCNAIEPSEFLGLWRT